MFPVLIQFGETLKLHTYGLMIFLGFIVGLNLAQRYARQIGEDDELIGDMGFWLLAWGLVGARVLFIMVNWRTYSSDRALRSLQSYAPRALLLQMTN